VTKPPLLNLLNLLNLVNLTTSSTSQSYNPVMQLLLLFLLLGDVLHLRSGGKVEGKVTEEGDSYVVQTASGTIRIKKEDVERIEKKDFVVPAAAKEKPLRLADSYSHPFFAFKLYLPAKWSRGENHRTAKCSFYGPKDQFYTPRLDLHIDRTTDDAATRAVKFKEAFKKQYKGVTFLRESAASSRGTEGCTFVAEFNDGDVPTHALWGFFVSGDRSFTLGFTVTKAWSDRYVPALESSMKSLRLYPEPKATVAEKQEFDKVWKAGGEASRKGDTDGAAAAFRRCVELLPDFPEAHAALAVALLKKNDWTGAEPAFRRAIELDPDDFTTNFNFGVMALRYDKLALAVTHLEKASAIDPTSEPALTNLGVALISRNDAKRAAEVLTKAVTADPESPPAHYNLGYAHEKLGDLKKAETEYRETLKLDKDHAAAKEALVRIKK